MSRTPMLMYRIRFPAVMTVQEITPFHKPPVVRVLVWKSFSKRNQTCLAFPESNLQPAAI